MYMMNSSCKLIFRTLLLELSGRVDFRDNGEGPFAIALLSGLADS